MHGLADPCPGEAMKMGILKFAATDRRGRAMAVALVLLTAGGLQAGPAHPEAAAPQAADPTPAMLSAGHAEASTWWAQAIVDAGGATLFDGRVIHWHTLVGDPYDVTVLHAGVRRFHAWVDSRGYGPLPLI